MKRYVVMIFALVGLAGYMVAQGYDKRPDSFYYRSGMSAYHDEDYAKSMEYFDEELKENPKNGYALTWKAYIYERYEMYGQALTCIAKALECVPKKDKQWMAMSYGFRGGIQAELGDTVKALADYEQAFKIDPQTDFIYKKVNLMNLQKRYGEIDVDLKRAYALDPNSPVVWVYMGRNDNAKKLYDQALEKYNYAVKLDPSYPSSYSFRATTYIHLEKYKEACQDIIKSLDLQYSYRDVFQLLMLPDEAMPYIESQLKAQQLKKPNDPQWSSYLGFAYAESGNAIQSVDAYREAVRIAAEAGETGMRDRVSLAESLNELGRYQEALDQVDAFLATDTTYSGAWECKAEIYYDMGKYMPAIEAINRAILLDTEDASIYSKRALMYMYSKKYRNAMDDINSAISLDPDYSYYLIQRGNIFLREGNTESAITDWNKVVEMETARAKDERSEFSLAFAYAHLGRRTETYPLIDSIGKSDKSEKRAEYNKACIYSLLGDEEAALEHLERALQLGFCKFFLIEGDTDLDNIRDTEKFKLLMEEYKGRYSNGVSAADMEDAVYVESVTEVPFTKEAGVCKVKCSINDLPLHFYFDTGAADVTISSVEAQFMFKNDYLSPADVKGSRLYGTASGDIAEGTVIMLRKVDFGGLELRNVRASVVHNQKAPLLLGQTVLERLGKIEIDYGRNVLKVTSRRKAE